MNAIMGLGHSKEKGEAHQAKSSAVTSSKHRQPSSSDSSMNQVAQEEEQQHIAHELAAIDGSADQLGVKSNSNKRDKSKDTPVASGKDKHAQALHKVLFHLASASANLPVDSVHLHPEQLFEKRW